MKANMISAAEIIAICDELDTLYETYDKYEYEGWLYCTSDSIKIAHELNKKIDDLEHILEEYENG